MGYKLTGIYIGAEKVRPMGYTLSYDFTQSDGGWVASNNTARDSSGFYREGDWSDGNITAPSEIFNDTPKKITIVFDKQLPSSGTAFMADTNYDNGYMFPREWDGQNSFCKMVNGTANNITVGTPSGVTTWEMEIDASTTPRTVTHNVTGLTSWSDTAGILDYIWNTAQTAYIRIVNRSDGTKAMCIQSVAIEY